MSPAEPALDDIGHVPPDLTSSIALPIAPPQASESLFRKRFRKFRRLKRGYYSFLFIVGAYAASFLLPAVAGSSCNR